MKYNEIIDYLADKRFILENNIKHLESKKAEIDEDIFSLNEALEDVTSAIVSITNVRDMSANEPGKFE